MNKVELLGRLTRDPQTSYTTRADGSQCCNVRFTIAVDRRIKRDANNPNQQTADFVSCKAWDKTAEFISKYFKQGMKICGVGRIETGNYVDREGRKVYTTDVIIDEAEFVESKAASSGQQTQAAAPQQAAPQTAPQAAPQQAPPTDNGGFMEVDNDMNLPF